MTRKIVHARFLQPPPKETTHGGILCSRGLAATGPPRVGSYIRPWGFVGAFYLICMNFQFFLKKDKLKKIQILKKYLKCIEKAFQTCLDDAQNMSR